MDRLAIRDLLNACHMAKRIVETLPDLPEGMAPRHVQVLDAICELADSGSPVRVSDVSAHLGATRPSVTRLITDLAEAGAIVKRPSENDGRLVLVEPTDLGRTWKRAYVDAYHGWLADRLSDIPSSDIDAVTRVMQRALSVTQSELDEAAAVVTREIGRSNVGKEAVRDCVR